MPPSQRRRLQLRIPFVSPLFLCCQILNCCTLPLFVVGAVWTRMAPAIAPAAVLLIPGFHIRSYCNVARLLARWIHVFGHVITHCKVFGHRKNQICFHNRFLSIAAYGRGAGYTPRRLAFAVQKLLRRKRVVFRAAQDQMRNQQGKASAATQPVISSTRGDRDAVNAWIPTNDAK